MSEKSRIAVFWCFFSIVYDAGLAQGDEWLPILNSEYIQGVTEEQWGIIEKVGEPLDCRSRVSRLTNAPVDNVVSLEDFQRDEDIIQKSLAKYSVTKLTSGDYKITSEIRVPKGKILIGEKKTRILSDDVSFAIYNNGSIGNVIVIGAQEYGVILGANSDLYNVIIRNTGVSKKINEIGNGVDSNGLKSHGNCIVSVEVSHGYNEKGTSPLTSKGGNADGFAVRNGAHDITFIDTHAHHNSDDGYDFWKGGAKADISDKNPTIRIFYSSSSFNGKNPLTPNGDGNGFKFGSGDNYNKSRGKDKGARLIYGSAACHNLAIGFDRNNTSRKIISINNHSYKNKKSFEKIFSSKQPDPYSLNCNKLLKK